MEGIRSTPGLFVLGDPPATVFAFGSRTIDVYRLAFQLKQKGWHLHAQHRPASLHMTVSPYHEKIVEPFLYDLRNAAEQLSERELEKPSDEAALYGMLGTMPDRETAKALALQYLDDLYRLND